VVKAMAKNIVLRTRVVGAVVVKVMVRQHHKKVAAVVAAKVMVQSLKIKAVAVASRHRLGCPKPLY
jgi:hypothetical protein